MNKNYNKPWTKTEIKLAMSTQLPLKEVAKKLNRTVQAVRDRRVVETHYEGSAYKQFKHWVESNRNGYNALMRRYREKTKSMAVKGGQTWTLTEDHQVLNTNMTDVELAQKLQRSLSAVTNRRYILKKKLICKNSF